MWGQCRGQQQPSLLETPFRSIHDVMATFSMPAVTHKPMEVESPTGKCLSISTFFKIFLHKLFFSGKTILNSMKLAFDDETSAG